MSELRHRADSFTLYSTACLSTKMFVNKKSCLCCHSSKSMSQPNETCFKHQRYNHYSQSKYHISSNKGCPQSKCHPQVYAAFTLLMGPKSVSECLTRGYLIPKHTYGAKIAIKHMMCTYGVETTPEVPTEEGSGV